MDKSNVTPLRPKEQNKKEDGMTAEKNADTDAFTLMANTNDENIPTEDFTIKSHEQWFGDSGASVHITNSDLGMFNIRPCDTGITIGDSSKLKCWWSKGLSPTER